MGSEIDVIKICEGSLEEFFVDYRSVLGKPSDYVPFLDRRFYRLLNKTNGRLSWVSFKKIIICSVIPYNDPESRIHRLVDLLFNEIRAENENKSVNV